MKATEKTRLMRCSYSGITRSDAGLMGFDYRVEPSGKESVKCFCGKRVTLRPSMANSELLMTPVHNVPAPQDARRLNAA